MASPAKLPKEGEDVIEGFIYNVSPRTQSRNNSPYFSAVIQSARTEYHRVVVFSMDKQATFSQAEKNGTAVRLRNVRRGLSYSDPGGFDVLCSRSTRVEVTSLPFMRSMPASCKAMTITEVKKLGPKQKVGEVHGKIKVHGCVNKVVSVNGMDCELKEVWICDGTGKIKLTLWDKFVNSAEVGKSYKFRNLCTRERDGCICLCTGPSSTIDQIADLEVEEEEEASVEEESTALYSAKIKGIAVAIQRKCSSCQFKQREFVEKSTIHRCEGCKMKQESLRFSASFGGKAIVSTDSGDESVLLTSSALSTYLRGAGLTNLSNDSEAIEDHFLQSPAFDLKVNLDGFLLSIEAARPREVGSSETAAHALSAEDGVSDAEGGARLTEEGNVVVEEGNAVVVSGLEA